MTKYLFLVSLTLITLSNAAITKRSTWNQQYSQQYEYRSSAPSSPLNNIIGAITNPLNILAERLTGRQPEQQQQYQPGFGPPGHHGSPGHHGPPHHHEPPGHHHGHHRQQQPNPFHHQQPTAPSFNPFLTYLPPQREQYNNFPQQPGAPFNQGQFNNQRPNFAQGQNYPKPGFSNIPSGNGNAGNKGNTGCNGFCQQPQPQQPNQFGNNNFGGFPNNAQNNNGFGGFGSNGNQNPQNPNKFGNNNFNNNNMGLSPNTPQGNNGFGQNRPSQGTGLTQSTFEGFGNNGNRTPQPTNQFGNNNGFDNNNFGGSANIPQTNNGQTKPLQGTGLIESTFGGFGNQGPQTQSPSQQPSGNSNNGLVSSVFGGFPENPKQNTQTPQNPAGNDLIESTFAGFGPNGIPISQPQPLPQGQPQTQPSNPTGNGENDLISGVFGGLSERPQSNNSGNRDNAAQNLNQSNGNGLIEGVFGGLQNPSPPKNDLISGVFGGFSERPQTNNAGDRNAQNLNPSNGNGLIEGVFGGLQTPSPPKNDLISGVFGGFSERPQTNNAGDRDNAAQNLNQSNGNGLIEGVFGGFQPPSPSKNDLISGVFGGFQPTTEMSAEMKANNNLVESIFEGINNGNGQNNVFGTSTPPTSTTNSEGLIYDIDVRSS